MSGSTLQIFLHICMSRFHIFVYAHLKTEDLYAIQSGYLLHAQHVVAQRKRMRTIVLDLRRSNVESQVLSSSMYSENVQVVSTIRQHSSQQLLSVSARTDNVDDAWICEKCKNTYVGMGARNSWHMKHMKHIFNAITIDHNYVATHQFS